MTVTVRPDPFTLIAYEAAEIAAIVAEVAQNVGLAPGVAIEVEVDEELFAPIVGYLSDVVDGVVKVWISGGNLEDSRRPRHFAPEQARRDVTLALLRARDRLSAGFADAPDDAGLTRGERAAWDVSANGRPASCWKCHSCVTTSRRNASSARSSSIRRSYRNLGSQRYRTFPTSKMTAETATLISPGGP